MLAFDDGAKTMSSCALTHEENIMRMDFTAAAAGFLLLAGIGSAAADTPWSFNRNRKQSSANM